MKRIIPFFLVASLLNSCGNKTQKENGDDLTKSTETTVKDDVPYNKLKEAYFGETHLHTSYSLDGYIGGGRLKPADAYRFASGEEVINNGVAMKMHVPLDFCAVTDHAEYLGEMYSMQTPGAPGYDHEAVVAIRNAKTYEELMALFLKYVVNNNRGSKPQHPEFYQGVETTKSAWKENQAATEKYYKPGKFTTIHGFEWTAAPGGANLHRNILFRTTAVTDVPMSAYEIPREEALWEWMKKERAAGNACFAIPHNSNASKGKMFDEADSNGKTIDAAYAKMRQDYEPLIEMMQIKGNSEVVSRFWANDEMADFENAPTMEKYSGRIYMKKNFVRYGLERGILYQDQLGVNPYKYGFAGGTDNHNGLAGNVEEDNYKMGSHGIADRTAQDRVKNTIDGWAAAYDINPGALTGVWATSNTRENIYDAMVNKEAFATSGVRIKVRLFAGYDFPAATASYQELVKSGYKNGVPMGGDMKLNGTKKPQFIVWAMKDPLQPGLDRIQIVKGWIENGQMKEKIYNVAVSDGRKINPDGSTTKLDAPIDTKTGAFNKTKGSTELKAVWTDPNFNPSQNAFYYARVIQLPTARWTLWDEIREGVVYPKEVSKSIQERAWSSPIWFTKK